MRFFSRIAPYFLLVIIAICIGCAVTIAVLGVLEWQRWNVSVASSELITTTNSLRPSTYQESVVITSVNTNAKTMIAQVRSSTAGQFIPTILRYTDDLEVQRRDVVIENGVIVGLTDTSEQTVANLLPGTHGIATIGVSDEGDLLLLRITIGIPLPRP